MASQNLNIKVKLDFDETSLKNLNLGTVRVDPDVNHFKSKLRSALNGNFKITPKINTKGISNQLNNIKNDMREFRNAAKDPIKINFDVDKDVLSDLAVVSRQLEKIQKASASATKMKLSGMSGISKTGDDLSTLVTAARKANKEITALEAKKKALESTGRSLSDKDALKLGDFQKQAQEYSNAIEKIISEKQKLDEQALRSTFKNSEKPTEEETKALAALKEKYATMRAQTEEYSKEEINKALAILEVERTVKNIGLYKKQLEESPEQELASLVNALAGGYTSSSPGGDPIVNPNTLPTGRNMFAINAEETPTEAAWEKGVQLAKSTIDMYRKRHDGEYPKKVSYTLWAGEFIETGGATIAQVLYMLGVEPIRDAFGRVSDLRLIPSKELGRPRIDVVVQTSGQLRDLAASRLFLVNRAVEMAAAAQGDEYENMVAAGVVESERALMEQGVSPKDAREMASFRVFGGANGGYGTGITGMVEAGDRWESEEEIANTYLNNMGAYYGSEKNWEAFRQFAFEAALTRTDVVIQPRQSNTWGALSLDHVYEFMGGMNLAVRNVTSR